MASGPSGRHRRYALVLLLGHALLVAHGAARHSPTWVEVEQLVAGISHWRFGTFDLGRVNPPLVRMTASLPVLLADPKTDWSRYDAQAGARSERAVRDDFLEANGARIFALHRRARWACIPFTLLGGYVSFVWGGALYGPGAGLLALALWCFSPNILGYAQLITPDAGATSLGIAAAYAFWRWLRRPDWPETFIAGLLLGLAELTKMTWIVLFGLWPLLWLLWRLPERQALGPRDWLRQSGQLISVLLIGLVVLNLGYGFEGTFTRAQEYDFRSHTLGGASHDPNLPGQSHNRFRGTWLGKLPVPLPKNYVMGIDLQKWDFEQKMASYLRGEWRSGGWWYYYLYALGVKVPLGTWLLVLLALAATCFSSGYSARWQDELVVLGPALAVLTFVSSQTGFSHHVRYVLLIFPFCFVWTSKVARALALGHRKIGCLAAGALVWSVGSSLWCYPHGLSYFNELAGGPIGGHAHLLGSNIDCGQDLLYLKRWLGNHPEVRPLGFAPRLACVDPRLAGIESTLPPPGPVSRFGAEADPVRLGPLPGWYALSVDQIRSHDDRYAYFLRLSPAAMVGYSIYICHVTRDEANRVRRQLGLPEFTVPAQSSPVDALNKQDVQESTRD